MSYCRCHIPVITTTSSSTTPNPHIHIAAESVFMFPLAGFFCFPPAHYPRLLPPPPSLPSPQKRLELIVQLLNILLKRNPLPFADNRGSNRFLTTVFHFVFSSKKRSPSNPPLPISPYAHSKCPLPVKLFAPLLKLCFRTRRHTLLKFDKQNNTESFLYST